MQGLGPLPGDLVWIRRRRWRVERVRHDRHVVRLDVAARDRRLTFLSPFDRALTRAGAASPRRVRPQEALARLASLVARTDDIRMPSAAIDAAADILPHQLEPAMAMLAGRSRLLIADEVGLGKTVQAGLIVAELLRRDAAARVIVTGAGRPARAVDPRAATPIPRHVPGRGSRGPRRAIARGRVRRQSLATLRRLDCLAGLPEATPRRRVHAARSLGPCRHRRSPRPVRRLGPVRTRSAIDLPRPPRRPAHRHAAWRRRGAVRAADQPGPAGVGEFRLRV